MSRYCHTHGTYAEWHDGCPDCREAEERAEERAREAEEREDERAREAEERAREAEERAEEARERAEERFEEAQRRADEREYRRFNPGDYKCPSCLLNTLLKGASVCPVCTRDVPRHYWVDVQNAEEEAARAEAIRRAKAAEEWERGAPARAEAAAKAAAKAAEEWRAASEAAAAAKSSRTAFVAFLIASIVAIVFIIRLSLGEVESRRVAQGSEYGGEPVTAQPAFSEMYKSAREWATDVLPLFISSNDVVGRDDGEGKGWMWTAVFVSPSRHQAQMLFYSTVKHDKFLRGVTLGETQPWSGPTSKNKPFQLNEIRIDSDAAYKAAYSKAEAWVKQHPDKKASFFLASRPQFPGPTWYVLWGTTKSGYLAFVNATTGTVVE